VWVQGTSGVRLLGNRIHDAGGEYVRLKDFAQRDEVAGNAIARCGRVRFDLAKGAKNGEGVYIGTAPEQAAAGPTARTATWSTATGSRPPPSAST
jgi:hypothetical protein